MSVSQKKAMTLLFLYDLQKNEKEVFESIVPNQIEANHFYETLKVRSS
jgi:hypothetical protein